MVAPLPLTPEYGWNEVAGRYVDSRGRFVSFQELRDANEAVIDAARQDIADISRLLQAGEIRLDEWQLRMMQDIKTINVLSAAEANGGWSQMSQSDWGAVGPIIKDQYGFLDNFANQVFIGDQPLNGNFLRRADLYGQAGRGTYEEMVRRYQEISNLMEEERRVLGAADHCPGCLEQASRGWQPIGTLDPIGAEECNNNCHCEFEYRRPDPAGGFIHSDDE